MSEVTICNLALSHLGDTAEVVSIQPPDSSVQAQLCSRFYYPARNALLEMASWGFATRRVQLAALAITPADGFYIDSSGTVQGPWKYMYAKPADCINTLAVQELEAPSDYQATFGPIPTEQYPQYPEGYMPVPGAPMDVPQPYSVEARSDGTEVILTNVADAVLRYTKIVTDTTKFSPLFTLALSHLLAAQLAGPLLKGEDGTAASLQQMELFEPIMAQAAVSDANERKTKVEPPVAWIKGR